MQSYTLLAMISHEKKYQLKNCKCSLMCAHAHILTFHIKGCLAFILLLAQSKGTTHTVINNMKHHFHNPHYHPSMPFWQWFISHFKCFKNSHFSATRYFNVTAEPLKFMKIMAAKVIWIISRTHGRYFYTNAFLKV